MAESRPAWPTPGAFDDIRVLEVGNESVDFCGLLLAGQGAEVVKIEPPGGAPSRRIGPFYEGRPDPDRSLFFWMYNRGKKSVTIDLANCDGQARYRELALEADVILDAAGIGAMDAIGLGHEDLAKGNPNLVYCSITPFGLTGPWRDFRASDLVHEALGGTAFCIGYDAVEPGRWDTPPFMPQAWHSFAITGEHAALAIAAALYWRQGGGSGQFIDVAIHDCCAQSTEGTVTRWIYNRREQVRAQQQQFRCADGRYLAVVFALLRLADIPKLREFLIREGHGEDLRSDAFASPAFLGDPALAAKLIQAMRGWASIRPAEAAFHGLAACRVLCGPVRPPEDLIDDPQCRERADFVEIAHPELGKRFVYPRGPNKQSETPWRWGPRAPLLGEHDGVIASRVAAEDIDAFKREGRP